MAHVCLINPPGIKTTTGLQMHTPNPPIGLAYVAAAAREAGHQVTLIDATGAAMDQILPMAGWPDILVQGLTAAEVVERIPPDVEAIGVTCMFSSLWPITRTLIAAIHTAFPQVPIILGGEHASAIPEQVFSDSAVSYCVIGEGEETIVELLDALSTGGDVSQVNGLAYPVDGTMVRTPPRERIRDLDAIPLPAWNLVPVEGYIERRQNNGMYQGRAMPILASRGCPFRCTFCSSPQMWEPVYAMRDVSLICDEVELYQRRYGATDFHFQDLTAIVSRKWIIALCDEMIRRGLKITWQLPSGTRSEAIDDEVCEKLAAAGFKQLSLAPESGSQHIREAIAKRVKMEHMIAAIRAGLNNGLSVSCFFVIGFPQETLQTLRETLRLARKLAWMGLPDIGVAKFVPYPGSALFKQLVEQGRITLNDDYFFSLYETYGKRHRSFAPAVSSKALQHRMVWIYLNFYLLSALRSPLRTVRNVLMALLTGREETRYSKWFSDFFKTRRQWARSAGRTPWAVAEGGIAVAGRRSADKSPGGSILTLPVLGSA